MLNSPTIWEELYGGYTAPPLLNQLANSPFSHVTPIHFIPSSGQSCQSWPALAGVGCSIETARLGDIVTSQPIRYFSPPLPPSLGSSVARMQCPLSHDAAPTPMPHAAYCRDRYRLRAERLLTPNTAAPVTHGPAPPFWGDRCAAYPCNSSGAPCEVIGVPSIHVAGVDWRRRVDGEGVCGTSPWKEPAQPLTEPESHMLQSIPSGDREAEGASAACGYQPFQRGASPSLYDAATAEQQLGSPLPYATISDGARRLNATGSRSAAAARDMFFGSTGASSTNTATATATPHSMTPSGGSATVAEPCCVMALIYNAAKEVGVALCELPSLTIALLQYGDTAAFFKTSSLLSARNPVEVLIPSTAVADELVLTLLHQHGDSTTFTSVQRRFYNAEEGVQRLLVLKSTAAMALCIEDTDRYLCVAAANALILYMEHINDMTFMPSSVLVRSIALDTYMEVSRTTARALQVMESEVGSIRGELPSASTSSTPSSGCWRGSVSEAVPLAASLIEAVPRACTVMGQRFLRGALLQPLRDRVAIQGRYDAVEWLLRDSRRCYTLRGLLGRMAELDLERLTAAFVQRPRRSRTEAQIQAFLESLVMLWSSLRHLKEIQAQLRRWLHPPPHIISTATTDEEPPALLPIPAHSTVGYPSVLVSVANALQQCRFEELTELMATHLDPSAMSSYSSSVDQRAAALELRQQFHGTLTQEPVGPASPSRPRRRPRSDGGDGSRASCGMLRALRTCFIAKASRGSELDALRTRFSCRIADITSYFETLRRTYELHSLRLEPDSSKMYCLSYAVAEEAKTLDGPFICRYAGGQHYSLYLSALRAQQQQVQHEGRRHGWAEGPMLSGPKQRRGAVAGGDDGRTVDGTFVFDSSFSSPRPPSLTTPAAGLAMGGKGGDGSGFDHLGGQGREQQHRRRRVRCTTGDLEQLCRRAQECLTAILQEQLRLVDPLLSALQASFLGALQSTVESISLLDTVLSFAGYSMTHRCRRPVLVDLDTGLTTASRVPVSTNSTDITGGSTEGLSLQTAAVPGVDFCPVSSSPVRGERNDSISDGGKRSSELLRPEFIVESARLPTMYQTMPQLRPGGARHGGASPQSVTMRWGTGQTVSLVTGPNACGKTTLLRMLGQLLVLSHAGCFIPVAAMIFLLVDRLFAHMLCDELPTVAQSSFKRELMGLSEITAAATPKSIVLIDELGRSSTTAQGFSLAWATALFLCERQIHLVLSTHYAGLAELSLAKPQEVRIFHFEYLYERAELRLETLQGAVTSRPATTSRSSLQRGRHIAAAAPSATGLPLKVWCSHELLPGPCRQRWYGLAFAETMGFFPPVLVYAKALANSSNRDSDSEMDVVRGNDARSNFPNSSCSTRQPSEASDAHREGEHNAIA